MNTDNVMDSHEPTIQLRCDKDTVEFFFFLQILPRKILFLNVGSQTIEHKLRRYYCVYNMLGYILLRAWLFFLTAGIQRVDELLPERKTGA